MRRNKLWLLSIFLILGLSVLSFGQGEATEAQKKSVKKLRKGLQKYSRYQFQNLTISFKALEFKTCSVSYKFISGQRVDETMSTSSPLDSYERTRGQQASTRMTSDGSEIATHSKKDTELNKINEKERSRSSKINTMNLTDLVLNSLQIKKLPNGIFLTVDIAGEGAAAQKKTEAFPVLSVKKAEKLKLLFVDAINKCGPVQL